jgi:hypothetical protein
MPHRSLLLLIRVACDNFYRAEYNDDLRKEILVGIYWVADAILENLQSLPDHKAYDHADSEIRLIQDYAEGALKGERSIRETISLILDCTWRAIPLPPE